ncbi:MAG: hypothetical protein ACLFVQ_12155 [Chitinispirillaceae bacterium]
MTKAVLSPSSSTILTVSIDDKVRIWDVGSDKATRELSFIGRPDKFKLSSDDTRLLTDRFFGHWVSAMEITSVSFSPDDKKIVTVSIAGTALVWDISEYWR